VEPFVLVIAGLVGGLVVWGLLRVGAKRPTANWAWALVFLFAVVLIVDLISVRVLGTNANNTFSTAPRQKAEGK
jgi:hypothetical protein